MATYYLYVKTHQTTGLKYLGVTSKKDPYSYKGSGKTWLRHLKEFGRNYTTEILLETDSTDEIREKGIYYSELWNIVDSKEWANQKKERGEGGWTPIKGRNPWNKGIPMSDEQRQKIRQTMLGKYVGKSNPFYGKTHSDETKEKLRTANIGRKIQADVVKARNELQKGVPKPSVSAKLKGKPKSEKHREKMKEAWVKRKQNQSTRLHSPPGYSPS